MSSVEPNTSNSQTTNSFSRCDKIAAFYEKYNIPKSHTTGAFGGKSYRWYASDHEETFQIECTCNVATFGFGLLAIKPTRGYNPTLIRAFRETSDVEHGKMQMKGVLGLAQH